MKETPLHRAFEDALRKIGCDPAQQHAARQLEALQRVVLDFRDAGLPATLTTRPAAIESALTVDEDNYAKALANGEIVMGDIRLDFVIQLAGYYKDQMSLQIFHGDEMVINHTSSFDEENQAWTEDEAEPEDADSDDEEEDIDWNNAAEDDDGKPQPHDLKAAVTALLVDLKSQRDFVSRFDVGPNGLPGGAVEKPFAVPGPLKLKKPKAP